MTRKKSSLKIDHSHIYDEEIQEDEQDYTSIKHVSIKETNQPAPNNQQVDDDSMRRHEMERGSDVEYERRNSLKRQEAQEEANVSGRDQLYIKEGNTEILRLITRGRTEEGENNTYANVPRAPQYIMVDNGGKEILMRRYIEEQANGKQIIREHYQVIPNSTYVQSQTLPNEVREKAQEKSQQQSQANLQASDALLVEMNEMTHAVSTHSIIQQELEQSLKTQNELLRQILLDKEKLEEKYKQEENALETQSLPCHSLTAAAQTQTDCEQGVQTDPLNEPKQTLHRRRTRSENDDSVSEEDYEYVRYSPPNSPNGVYFIKRRRHTRKKGKYKGDGDDNNDDRGDRPPPHRKSVVVESVKRKIRTPIQEESEEITTRTPHMTHKETRTSSLRRQKVEMERGKSYRDDIDDDIVPTVRTRTTKKYYLEDTDGSENEVIMHKNYYSADSLDDYEEDRQDRRRRVSESVPPTPAARGRGERGCERDRDRSKNRKYEETITVTRKAAPKPPEKPKQKTRFETDTPETKAVPRYMEWYVKSKEVSRGQNSLEREKKGVSRKISRSSKSSDDSNKSKPEPLPRGSEMKENARLLKEDKERARKVESKTSRTDSNNHPLLQHSEHRFEYEYQSQTNTPQPPTKLPHYLYPNTPPAQQSEELKANVKFKPKASPIKESEVSKTTTTTIKIPIDNAGSTSNITTTTTTTTVAQHQHEDDHDSGIAMNSLLMGKRNKKADKKSVFTIAYDDVQVPALKNEIQSDNTTPPFS